MATRWLAPLAVALMISGARPTLGAPPAVDPDPWWGKDKALHFGLSAGVAGAGYGLSALGTEDIRVRIAFGAGAGIVVGAAKELFDLAGLGHPSWKDFTWDVIGTALGVGISVSIDLILRAALARPVAAR